MSESIKSASASFLAVTRQQFINMLFAVKGVTFISFKSTTVPHMNKGGVSNDNGMFGMVTKDSTVNVMEGYDDNKRVNKIARQVWGNKAIQSAVDAGIDIKVAEDSVKLVSEYCELPKIKAKRRGWGEHMLNTVTDKISNILVDYTKPNGEYGVYFQCEVMSVLEKPIYRYSSDHDNHGQILSKEDQAMVELYTPKKKKEDRVVRSYGIGGINKVCVNGGLYQIIDNS